MMPMKSSPHHPSTDSHNATGKSVSLYDPSESASVAPLASPKPAHRDFAGLRWGRSLSRVKGHSLIGPLRAPRFSAFHEQTVTPFRIHSGAVGESWRLCSQDGGGRPPAGALCSRLSCGTGADDAHDAGGGEEDQPPETEPVVYDGGQSVRAELIRNHGAHEKLRAARNPFGKYFIITYFPAKSACADIERGELRPRGSL